MATHPPQVEADGLVTVRLSDIGKALRVDACWRLVKKLDLTMEAAVELAMAAEEPVQDPEIRVTPEKAYRVLVLGKAVAGPMPPFEK